MMPGTRNTKGTTKTVLFFLDQLRLDGILCPPAILCALLGCVCVFVYMAAVDW